MRRFKIAIINGESEIITCNNAEEAIQMSKFNKINIVEIKEI